MDIKNYDTIFTKNAEDEMNEIYNYISERLFSKASAEKLMKRIENKVLRLEQFPYSCEKVHIKPRNESFRKLIVDNYIVLYRINEKYKRVNIFYVLYSGQDYLL